MSDDEGLDRRALLRGSWLKPKSQPKTATETKSYDRMKVTRPPGAVTEDQFLELCTGCGDCITACPHDVIYKTGVQTANGEASPVLFITVSACHLCEDTPCIAACETGALVPTDRVLIRLSEATVVPDNCWSANGHDPECNFCADACPLNEIAISHESGSAPNIHEDGCTGCGLCFHACPAPGKPIQINAV
jgi:ferredoxin-type protein NapG